MEKLSFENHISPQSNEIVFTCTHRAHVLGQGYAYVNIKTKHFLSDECKQFSKFIFFPFLFRSNAKWLVLIGKCVRYIETMTSPAIQANEKKARKASAETVTTMDGCISTASASPSSAIAALPTSPGLFSWLRIFRFADSLIRTGC